MLEILLPVIGFIIGTIATMAGIGGGAYIVPTLTILYSFAPANAVGTSLTCIIFTAAAATINYWRQKRIFFKTGLIMAVLTAPGALLGAYITTILSPDELGSAFAIFIVLIAIRLTFTNNPLTKGNAASKPRTEEKLFESDSEMISAKKTLAIGIFLGFFGGIASGLFGLGGGVLVVPIMTLAMRMPIHAATATSMFTMVFTTASGVTQHYFSGHVNFEYALLLAVGTVLGAQLGAHWSRRVSGDNLRRFLAVVLVIVAVQMILRYAGIDLLKLFFG
jgi:uncharacterized membrane protein YfcA